MLIDIYIGVSLAGALVTVWLTQIHWLFFFAIAPGYILGLFVLHLTVALIISLFVNKKAAVDRVSGFWHYVTVQTTYAVLRVAGVRYHVVGDETIPRDCRFMLVSNHLSRFDPMICMVHFRRMPLAFVSKPENFDIPIAGAFIHKCRFLPIDRENARNALTTLNTAASYIRSGDMSVGIYPEGTRSKSGELLEFKDGVFKIARDSRAPIVVMTVRGTDRIKNNFPFHTTTVELRIVRVIRPEEFAGMRIGEISAMVRRCMVDDLREENVLTTPAAAE